MPWCPKCKMEYKEGVAQCADCGTALVADLNDTLEDVELARLEKEETTEKLVGFLTYSGIRDCSYSYSEPDHCFIVTVKEDSLKKAKKLYEGFRLGEKETSSEKTEDVEEKSPEYDEASEEDAEKLFEETKQLRTKPSATYVKKEEQYRDLSSSASMFLVFAAAGLIIIILNAAGIMSFLNGPLPYILLTLLCLGMVYVGISCFLRARKIKEQISGEEELTRDIKKWLVENITQEYLDSLDDASLSREINFLNKTERIRDRVMEQFGEMNESYADQIIEEFYNAHFEA